MMQGSQPSVIARDHTILGVCEALGEDFRFNPLWLRAALALGLLWNPLVMIYAYLGMGTIVLISRLLAPNPRRAVQAQAEPAAQEPPAANELDQYPLPIAA